MGHHTRDKQPVQQQSQRESGVRSEDLKQIMRKCIDSGSDPFLAILDHRNTPSQGLLSSPAQRLMNRRTKTLLPTVTALLRPQVVDAQHTSRDIKRGQNRQAVYYNRGASDKQALEEGDTVRLQPFKLGRKDWSKGTVIKRLDERSYVIGTPKGVVRRNRQHLKKTTENYVQQPTEGAVDFRRTDSMTPMRSIPEIDLPPEPETPDTDIPASTAAQPLERAHSTEQRDTVTRSGRAIKLPTRYRD